MLRILMLDLGGTLIEGQSVLPRVPEALDALRQLKTANGAPLALCLVSDFHMPDPPVTPDKIQAIFQQYITLLDSLNLTQFFPQVDRQVTLSTHAGVFKPKRQIFELAIARLGIVAGLDACLFITENAEHVAAARLLGLEALRFGLPGTPGVDFDDWSDAPLLVAHRVAPNDDHNLLLALNVRVARDGRRLSAIERRLPGGRIRVRETRQLLVPDPRAGTQSSIAMEAPMSREIKLGPDGRVEAAGDGEQDAEALAEATHFVETLEANQQIAHEPGPLPAGATHQVETDEQGQRILKRKRFSAI